MFKYFVFACVLAFTAAAPGPAPASLITSPGLAYTSPLATSYSSPLLLNSPLAYNYKAYAAAPYAASYASPYAYSAYTSDLRGLPYNYLV